MKKELEEDNKIIIIKNDVKPIYPYIFICPYCRKKIPQVIIRKNK